MTVQIVEIAGEKMAVLPIADYEALLDAVEDRADVEAAIAADHRRKAGESYLPGDAIDRILAGESALRVWRRFRRLTQSELASRAGYHTSAVSQAERGERVGSHVMWQSFANALGVTVNDISPPS